MVQPRDPTPPPGDCDVEGVRRALRAHLPNRHALRRAGRRGGLREDTGADPRREHPVRPRAVSWLPFYLATTGYLQLVALAAFSVATTRYLQLVALATF